LQGLSQVGLSDARLSDVWFDRQGQPDRGITRWTHAGLRNVSAEFRLRPRFYFYDDGENPNAYAVRETIGAADDYPADYRDGIIVMGTNLLDGELDRREMSGPGTLQTNSVPEAILAHEFAHLRQFRKSSPLAFGKPRELHADYLAGWYIRRVHLKYRTNFNPAKAGRCFYQKGDTAFYSPQHHGTKDERLAAFLAGYGDESPGVHDAYARGQRYVRSSE
jgi:hypothetical protein